MPAKKMSPRSSKSATTPKTRARRLILLSAVKRRVGASAKAKTTPKTRARRLILLSAVKRRVAARKMGARIRKAA